MAPHAIGADPLAGGGGCVAISGWGKSHMGLGADLGHAGDRAGGAVSQP